MAEARIVRRSAFVKMPWKNGGGITHEAIRVPADGDSFMWRVSLAQIDRSGPFSGFAGYSRRMILLKGGGLELDFGDGRRRRLDKTGDLVEFDGALAPECRLLEGPCVDLNLMVAKSHAVTARIERVQATLDMPEARGAWTLIFGVEGAVDLHAGEDEASRLEPWDLAILSNSNGRLCRPESSVGSCPSVFIATISQ
jgi:environmental stress-induced protein Ves